MNQHVRILLLLICFTLVSCSDTSRKSNSFLSALESCHSVYQETAGLEHKRITNAATNDENALLTALGTLMQKDYAPKLKKGRIALDEAREDIHYLSGKGSVQVS